MHQFSMESVQAVASDIRSVFASTDCTVSDAANLMMSFIKATSEADLGPVLTQKTLKSVSAGIEHILEGRAQLIRAHQAMTVLKDDSNLAVVDFGCLFGRKQPDNPLYLVPEAA